ncbi:MAG: DUF4129 domain-containing protein [Candidatus Dormibacteria bacterium]
MSAAPKEDPGLLRPDRTVAVLAAVCALTLLVLAAVATHAAFSRPLLAAHPARPSGVETAAVSAVGVVVLTVFFAAVDLAIVLTLFLIPWRRFREVGRPGAPVAKLSRGMKARLVLLAASLVVAQWLVLALTLQRRAHPRVGVSGGGPTAQGLPGSHPGGTVPVADTLLLGALLGLVFGLVVIGLVIRQRRRSSGWRARDAGIAPAPGLPEELAGALDAGLEELESSSDPRRAVLLSYARMERTLGERGLPRQQFETHLEYLERALRGLRASPRSLRRLTDLFELARYSQHEVRPTDRSEAEAALAQLRDELRSAPG